MKTSNMIKSTAVLLFVLGGVQVAFAGAGVSDSVEKRSVVSGDGEVGSKLCADPADAADARILSGFVPGGYDK